MVKVHHSTSKFLSFVLRHKPESIGLCVDPEGWANIEELLSKADIPLTEELLLEVVENSDKRRFSISSDGLSIRANQGHSFEVNLGLNPIAPPKTLFHGTGIRFLKSIEETGLLPQSRQYVHLSENEKSAKSVGQRHGKPVVLSISASVAHDDGYDFFRAANGVWLTKHVPAAFISTLSQ